MKEIKIKLIPNNTAARSGYILKPKYITLHNTANTKVGASAENHAIYMHSSGKNSTASYHYVVDDKEIYRFNTESEILKPGDENIIRAETMTYLGDVVRFEIKEA